MTTETTTTTRRCIGSSRFGIEAHDADAGDFPAQPSQKDGLGRMCKLHWREYTNALRKAAVARKAGEVSAPEPEAEIERAEEMVDEATEPEAPAPRRSRRAKAEVEPAAEAAEATAE